MLNFNLSKDDIGYLRLIIDIQSCDDVKKSMKASIYSDKNIKSNFSIFEEKLNNFNEKQP